MARALLLSLMMGCAAPGERIRVTPRMTVTELRAALGGCALVLGTRRQGLGRAVRLQWPSGHLDGIVRCEALPEDPAVHQAGIIFWEPNEQRFSIGHPSGPGRWPFHGPFDQIVDGYFFEGNDRSVQKQIEESRAIPLLSALGQIAPWFARLSFQ